ncbi:hypothetical protein ACSBR2_035473 [Camellia fascicularis]
MLQSPPKSERQWVLSVGEGSYIKPRPEEHGVRGVPKEEFVDRPRIEPRLLRAKDALLNALLVVAKRFSSGPLQVRNFLEKCKIWSKNSKT